MFFTRLPAPPSFVQVRYQHRKEARWQITKDPKTAACAARKAPHEDTCHHAAPTRTSLRSPRAVALCGQGRNAQRIREGYAREADHGGYGSVPDLFSVICRKTNLLFHVSTLPFVLATPFTRKHLRRGAAMSGS